MKITDIFSPEDIVDELGSCSPEEVLRRLCSALIKSEKIPEVDKAVEILMAREKLGGTGIGDGVAVPHGKMKGLEKLVIAFGRSGPGIDFAALDDQPVHLFFLLLAPEHSSGIHLKALAKISRILKDPNFRQKLLEAPDATALYGLIQEADETF